jgi:hypothetical protein
MSCKIVLYIIFLNKETLSYDILSEHPERFEECWAEVNFESSIDDQVADLFSKYCDLSPEYIRFIHLKPEIIINNYIKIPFYCLVPFNSQEIKNSYKISCNEHAKNISNIRQILNII